MSLVDDYVDAVKASIGTVLGGQTSVIDEVAERIAASLRLGNVLHIFGSGHSHMIAREIFSRAGQLIPVSAIVDKSEGRAERAEGYAERMLRYYQWYSGEVIIIVSNSGRNALPIEIAMKAKNDGLYVVALTSLDHTQNVTSRHSSGKKLCDLADVVLDNGAPKGDACVALPGTELKVGPISTITGCLLVNALMLTVMEKFLSQGEIPPVSISTNLDGTDERSTQLRSKYLARIRFE